MPHHLKEIVLTIIITFSIPLYAQHGITAQYQSFSLEERMRIMAMMQQAYERAGQEIRSLEKVIIDYLSQDVDDDFRSKLNNYYREVQTIKNQYQQQGLKGIKPKLDSIYDRLNNDIINYNNRISQKRKEKEHPSSWTGTGFALNHGYIVTNYHVVKGSKHIQIQGINGNLQSCYNATVAAVDETRDLAIIKVNDARFFGFGTIPYTISSQSIDVGEDVWTLGYPLAQLLGNEIKLSNGIISSNSGYRSDYSLYQITAPLQPGNSGGPLFDSKGNIIGIVNAGVPDAENVGYAIKTTYLKILLNRANLSNVIPVNNTIASLSLKDQVKIVRQFVFMINCSANEDESRAPKALNTVDNRTSNNSSSANTYSPPSSYSTSLSRINSPLNSKTRCVIWGKCVDEFGTPVKDAIILNSNISTKKSTTLDGQFAISAKLGDTLVIQKKGFITETVAPEKQNIHVILYHEDNSSDSDLKLNNDSSPTHGLEYRINTHTHSLKK